MFYSVVDNFGNFSAVGQMCRPHTMTYLDFPLTMNSYHIDPLRMVAVCNWHLYIQHRVELYPHRVVWRAYDRLEKWIKINIYVKCIEREVKKVWMENFQNKMNSCTYKVKYFCIDFYCDFQCDVLLCVKMCAYTLVAVMIQILPKIRPINGFQTILN